ncbi:MAG: hypothetical protein M3R08_00445 [Bacteroidota bacterium]|nr:hypothetical protein [Bacteroidota bacterium]
MLTCKAMSLINVIFLRLERFEQWFDSRFGWFFTNGMKEQHQADPSFKA